MCTALRLRLAIRAIVQLSRSGLQPTWTSGRKSRPRCSLTGRVKLAATAPCQSGTEDPKYGGVGEKEA